MSNKLLVCYCVCGVRGLERIDLYLQHLASLQAQTLAGVRICIKGTLSTRECKRVLQSKLGDSVSYLWLDELVPVNVGFNAAVKRCIKAFGPFDGYVYSASDVDLLGVPMGFNSPLGLMEIEERLNYLTMMHYRMSPTDPLARGAAMVVSRCDGDCGFEDSNNWCGVDTKAIKAGDYVIPVGKGVNCHFQLFSHELVEAYGAPMPDIFTGDTTESVFTFLCAAIKRKMLMMSKPVIRHIGMMDGASAGFQRRGEGLYGAVLRPHHTNLKRICEEGHRYGMGYEECQSLHLHDPGKFDADGNALDDRLLPFLRDNLFLPPDQLDYDLLQGEFLP